MVFKRSVAMLALAVAALAVTAQAEPVTVHTNMKNPVVKHVSHDHGKVHLVLTEGSTISKKAPVKKPVAPKYAEVKKAQDAKKPAVKKVVVKKPTLVKVAPKKVEAKKHVEVKKPVVKKPVVHKKVTETKKDGEIVRKYAHGEVRVMTKPQTHTDAHKKAQDAKKPAVKKVVVKKPVIKKVEVKKPVVKKPVAKKAEVKKPVVKKPVAKKVEVKKPVAKKAEVKKPVVKKPVVKQLGDDVEEADVDLESGEVVELKFGEHVVELELFKNGSLVLTADGEQYVLPHADNVDITIGDEDEGSTDEDSSSSDEVDEASDSGSGSLPEESFVEELEEDVSKAAKKFTEFATKVTGNGKFFSKEAAPVVFVGGVIGALAAVVGIAAIAVGRARSNSAAADPQSVLAEATEDVDVEANVTAEENKEEDAAADDSHSLDGSESESDSDVEGEKEEGKFMNEGSV